MATTAPPQYTDPEIREIGNKQKAILWTLLASIVLSFVPYGPIAASIISVIFIYQLAAALKSRVAWLYVILAFFPLVSLIALLVINSQATKALKARGLKVGLMGASSSALSALGTNSRHDRNT